MLDSIAWVHDHLLERLTVARRVGTVAVHPTCSAGHLGLAPKLEAVARALADEVVVPAGTTCCGMAGDRGLLHPELPASALRDAAAELEGAKLDAYLSSQPHLRDRRCTQVTGRPYALVRLPAGGAHAPSTLTCRAVHGLRSASLLLPALCALALLAGCGGDDDDGGGGGGTGEGARAAETRQRLNGADAPNRQDFPRPQDGQTLQAFANGVGASGTQVGLATSIFTPGRNRLAFGVLSSENRFVYGPTAVYVARSPGSTDVRGPYVAPADLLVTEPAFRSEQAATESDPFAAVYEANDVPFGEPGEWAVLVVTRLGGDLVAAPTTVQVRRSSPIPDVGDKAPVVETDTAAEDGGPEAVDTRRPTSDLHDVSFDAVAGKKPVALLFATPQLCQSRVCGPVVDIALQLRRGVRRPGGVHPPGGLRRQRRQQGAARAVAALRLPTEPWLFTVSKDGTIAARLEGSFGLKALRARGARRLVAARPMRMSPRRAGR